MWKRRKDSRLDLKSKPSNLSPTPASSSRKETGSLSPKVQPCRQFTIAEIRSATQNFNKSLIIGGGRFGNVYKSTIKKNGTRNVDIVALKRWNSNYSHGFQEFEAEIHIIPMVQHPNIVCLIGYCNDVNEMILVYEYMSNGSLEDHLHKHRTPLSWSQRLKICIDVALALDYLHDATSGQDVIYNNVKSSDILLDNEWRAKIADFGLSKKIPVDNPDTHLSTEVVGTYGYVDPEYISTGKLSKKSDVYSFGVVLLEVLCRRRAMDIKLDRKLPLLVEWAQVSLRTGKLEQIIDPDLRGQISIKCLNDYARLVQCCLREHQETRVTIAEVVFGLESILALHERNVNSVPQMGITTSDWRLQKHFFSSGENTGESYFRKDIELLSAPSDHHEDIISEKSYERLVTSQQQSIQYHSGEFDPTSEPNHEVIDGELLSGDQTKSLYELMQLEYIQLADVFMRMKDFLLLVRFYHVKEEVEVNCRSLLDKFSSLNEYIRKSVDSPRDRRYLIEIQAVLQDVEEDLNEAAFDMVAYLPEDNWSGPVGFDNLAKRSNPGQVSVASLWSCIPEVHASAVASAVHRAVSCIKVLKVKKLGISGSGSHGVAETLKDMPELRSAFDMVLCVRVKHHDIEELINDIEEEIHLWRKRSPETDNETIAVEQFLNCLLFVDSVCWLNAMRCCRLLTEAI